MLKTALRKLPDQGRVCYSSYLSSCLIMISEAICRRGLHRSTRTWYRDHGLGPHHIAHIETDGLRKLGFLTRHHRQSGPYHEGSLGAWAVHPTDEHLVTKVCTGLAYVASFTSSWAPNQTHAMCSTPISAYSKMLTGAQFVMDPRHC